LPWLEFDFDLFSASIDVRFKFFDGVSEANSTVCKQSSGPTIGSCEDYNDEKVFEIKYDVKTTQFKNNSIQIRALNGNIKIRRNIF